MRKILIVVAVFALTLWAVNTYAPIHGEEKIYDSVIRLHVIASSDSEEDQALKLKVRDALLAEMPRVLTDCESRDEARKNLEDALPSLTECARSVLSREGYTYGCSLSLTDEKYPTRSYEDVCFPAGEYCSLQVKLGESEGKNWWCVLFPELCLSGASSAESAFIEVGFTPEQYKIITESDETKYKIRFKFLEVIEDALG